MAHHYMGRVTVFDELPDDVPDDDPRRLTQDEINQIEHLTKQVSDELHAKLQAHMAEHGFSPIRIGVNVTASRVRYFYDRHDYPTRACVEMHEPMTAEQLALGWKPCTDPDMLADFGVR